MIEMSIMTSLFQSLVLLSQESQTHRGLTCTTKHLMQQVSLFQSYLKSQSTSRKYLCYYPCRNCRGKGRMVPCHSLPSCSEKKSLTEQSNSPGMATEVLASSLSPPVYQLFSMLCLHPLCGLGCQECPNWSDPGMGESLQYTKKISE